MKVERRSRGVVAVVVVVAAQAWASTAWAGDKALAEATFEDGRKLMKDGKVAEACAKFEASYAADPANDDGRLLRRRDADPIANPPAVDPHSLYYLADGRLNVARLVDAAGADRARYDLDAWGNTLSQSGSFAPGEMFRYRSGHRDRETGLYQFGARWYDPQVGRWLSQDPLLQGLILAHDDVLPRWADLSNLYVYASNNPVMLFDPGGLVAHLPKGWPTPPGWKGGYKWKNNEKGELVDPAGQRWHWHPEDTSHNEHWDMQPRKGPKRRVDRNGKDLGDEAFKADDVKPEPVSDWDRVSKTEEVEVGAGEGVSSGGGGSSTAKYVAGGAATVGGGIGLWEISKWTVAILATPVTEGGSLAAAGALP